MFFVLSKLLGFFTEPSNIAVLLACGGVVLLATRWRKAAIRLMVGGIVLLLVFGYSPLGDAALLTLSERFPAWTDNGRTPDGIIVLGGSISPDISSARRTAELNASSERITAGVELAHRFPNIPIVFSGGSANLIDMSKTEAMIAVELWTAMGVARERIRLEDRSRNTVENAILTRELVKPKPGEMWLLVTSAYHMPRSVGVFRAVGFDVVAYPVDWRTRGWRDALVPFASLSGGLARMDTAAHEWVGLLAYWLTGKTSELLPGPLPGSR
jgi:uncharacterized SAM-binding protein YcdF (DUF218 family)